MFRNLKSVYIKNTLIYYILSKIILQFFKKYENIEKLINLKNKSIFY